MLFYTMWLTSGTLRFCQHSRGDTLARICEAGYFFIACSAIITQTVFKKYERSKQMISNKSKERLSSRQTPRLLALNCLLLAAILRREK